MKFRFVLSYQLTQLTLSEPLTRFCVMKIVPLLRFIEDVGARRTSLMKVPFLLLSRKESN